MKPEDRRALWDRIAASTQATTFETVLTTEIGLDLYALENGNSNIQAALASAVTALSTSALTSQSLAENSQTRTPEPPPSFLFKNSPAKDRKAQPISVSPGLAIDNQFSKAEGSFFSYNTGYVDQEGVSHSTNPAQVGGENKFAPEAVSTPIPLTLDGDHTAENYSIIILQPIFDKPEPAIFNNSEYSGEVAKWRASLVPMLRRGYSSVASSAILDAFGAPGVDFSPAALDETITNYSEVSAEAAATINEVGNAQGLGTLVARMAGVAATGDTEAFNILAAVSPLLRSSYPELAEQLATKSLTSAQIQGFKGTMRILSALGSWNYSSRTGPIAETFTTGEIVEVVEGAMKAVLLTLDPDTSEFEAGKSLLLTAKPHPGFTNPFTYTWELQPGPGAITNAVLNDNQGKVGTKITTTSPTVYLVTGNDSVGLAVVKVNGETTDDDGSPLFATTEATYTPQGHLEFSPIEFADYPGVSNYRGLSSGSWVIKPAPVNGVYAAAQLKIVGQVHGFGNSLDGKFEKHWNIPAFSGPISPSSKDPVYFQFTSQVIHPSLSIGPSTMGIGVIDYGDRLLIRNHSGAYDINDPEYKQTLTNLQWQWANSTSLRYSLK